MQTICLTQNSVKHSHTYRQQGLNVFLQKGGDVLPVQDVPEPAVPSLRHHLMTTVASSVGRVLGKCMECFVHDIFKGQTDQNINKLNGKPDLHKPGVVQSVPELQHLLLNHSCVVHLVS